MIMTDDTPPAGRINVTAQQPTEPGQVFPGGEAAPAYRSAFTLWLVLFLGVVCLGFLNYLGVFAKRVWPNL